MNNAEALRALDLADWIDCEIIKINDAKWGAIENHDDGAMRMLGTFSDKLEFIRAHLTDPGYVRVPVEPTAEMIRKGQGQWSGESMVEIYKAMLAAATQPVEQQPISHDWDDQDKCRRCGDRDWYASATCTPKHPPSALTEATGESHD